MAASDIITPYYNADCSVFADTTWVATIVGRPVQPVRVLMVATTVDKALEFGFVAGTGATASGYIIGTPHVFTIDMTDGFLFSTLYVRMRAGGTAPTANTVLAISALG